LLLRNGKSTLVGISSEQKRKSHDKTEESEQDHESVSDVDDVVVSAPDRVIVMVVLMVRRDRSVVSVVNSVVSVVGCSVVVVVSKVVVVEERHALTNKDGSKNDVNNQESK